MIDGISIEEGLAAATTTCMCESLPGGQPAESTSWTVTPGTTSRSFRCVLQPSVPDEVVGGDTRSGSEVKSLREFVPIRSCRYATRMGNE
jgi:hypothetical protein